MVTYLEQFVPHWVREHSTQGHSSVAYPRGVEHTRQRQPSRILYLWSASVNDTCVDYSGLITMCLFVLHLESVTGMW